MHSGNLTRMHVANCTDTASGTNQGVLRTPPLHNTRESVQCIMASTQLLGLEEHPEDTVSLHWPRFCKPTRRSQTIVDDENDDAAIISSCFVVHDHPSESAGPEVNGSCEASTWDSADDRAGVLTTCHEPASRGANAVATPHVLAEVNIQDGPCSVSSACDENRQDAIQLALDRPASGFLLRDQIVNRPCPVCIHGTEVNVIRHLILQVNCD